MLSYLIGLYSNKYAKLVIFSLFKIKITIFAKRKKEIYMNEKRLEQRLEWIKRHPDITLKHDKLQRKASHDYRGKGIYMITLCTEQRKTVLGTLRDNDERHELPWVEPSELGRNVILAWRDIQHYYPKVQVIAYQLMPDHFHGIIYVTEDIPQHLGQIVNGFKIGCNRALRRLLAKAEAVPQPTPTTAPNEGLSLPLWEKSYHDRILRGKGQLQNMVNYVHDNPRRLWIKRQHPDFFTSHSELMIAGTAATTIGNQFLLNFPLKVQVQCSRKLTEEQIEDKWKEILDLAEQGYVIVTPGISQGEKTIMNRAIDASFPIIIPTRKSYSSKEKPPGRLFDACAQGKLLLVSPQLKDNENNLTQAQCRELNDLARTICGT